MSRIAILCGTGMGSISELLINSTSGISENIVVDSEWGRVPIESISSSSGDVYVVDRHHAIGESRKPPHSIEHRANVHAATSCNPDLIISVNSVGSMTQDFPPGAVGVASGILDLSDRPWTFYDENAVHSDRTSPFDQAMSEICVNRLILDQGSAYRGIIVAQCVGPQYESPSEIDALEMLGANVVGMTLGPEQRLISETGISHVAIICSSNWAAGRSPGNPLAEIDHTIVDKMASSMQVLVTSCVISLLEKAS